MKKHVLILIYFLILSALSIAITIYDKAAAKLGKWRIPEKMLLLCGFCGGALPMFITMKTIHHKTRHKKFMLGLPVIILIQAAVIAIYIIQTTAEAPQ